MQGVTLQESVRQATFVIYVTGLGCWRGLWPRHSVQVSVLRHGTHRSRHILLCFRPLSLREATPGGTHFDLLCLCLQCAKLGSDCGLCCGTGIEAELETRQNGGDALCCRLVLPFVISQYIVARFRIFQGKGFGDIACLLFFGVFLLGVDTTAVKKHTLFLPSHPPL